MSIETTPPDSEQGSIDSGERNQAYGHSRASSLRENGSMHRMHSSQSISGRPRTYFTHSGQVTVEGEDDTPVQIAARAAIQRAAEVSKAVASPAPEKVTSKRSRFSLGFGKKSAAH